MVVEEEEEEEEVVLEAPWYVLEAERKEGRKEGIGWGSPG